MTGKADLNAFEIISHKGQLSMGGLMWRPLTTSKTRDQAAEIRELADVFSAQKIVWLQEEGNPVVGLYRHQSLIPGEKSPAKPYSAAATLAKLLPKGLNLVVAPVTCNMQELYSLIVVEDGKPVIDTALDRESLEHAISAYVESGADERHLTIYCDEANWLPNSRYWPESWRTELFEYGIKIQPVPVDYLKIGGIAATLAITTAGAAFGYQHYSQQLTLAKLKAANDQQVIQAYRLDLKKQSRRIGFDFNTAMTLVDQLMDQPFVNKGWVLESIDCKGPNCQSTWRSEGGYTEEIIAALPTQAPNINPLVTDKVAFNFGYPLEPSGVRSVSDLHRREDLTALLYEEQQAWQKADIGYRIDLKGQVWPSGHQGLPKRLAVMRYPVEISGEPALVMDFLQRYGGLAFYDQIRIDVNMASLEKAIKIQVKGAFYAS